MSGAVHGYSSRFCEQTMNTIHPVPLGCQRPHSCPKLLKGGLHSSLPIRNALRIRQFLDSWFNFVNDSWPCMIGISKRDSYSADRRKQPNEGCTLIPQLSVVHQ